MAEDNRDSSQRAIDSMDECVDDALNTNDESISAARMERGGATEAEAAGAAEAAKAAEAEGIEATAAVMSAVLTMEEAVAVADSFMVRSEVAEEEHHKARTNRRGKKMGGIGAKKRARTWNATAQPTPMTAEECLRTGAANVIRRYWRCLFRFRTTGRLMRRVFVGGRRTAQGVPEGVCHSAVLKNMSFEALVIHLRERATVEAMKHLLQRIHVLCGYRHFSQRQRILGAYPPSQEELDAEQQLQKENSVNVRVFLAGYMIAFFGSHVFEDPDGQVEKTLTEVAAALINVFEGMCQRMMAEPTTATTARGGHSGGFRVVSPHESRMFTPRLAEYVLKFHEWKVPDEKKLVMRIRNALHALYEAQAHLPCDEDPESTLSVEFRTQIARLREKMQQIAGKKAVDEFDEERRQLVDRGERFQFLSAIDRENCILPQPPSNEQRSALPLRRGRTTNEELAHELLLDPQFQLDDRVMTENDVEAVARSTPSERIMHTLNLAFWVSLAEELKFQQPSYTKLLRCFQEIHDGLLELGGADMRAHIGDVIDVPFIRDRLRDGNYGYAESEGLIRNVLAIIQRIQNPTRDSETRARWMPIQEALAAAWESEEKRVDAMVGAVRFLVERMQTMRIDAANARLRLIAPVIREHGIDYEKGKFRDKLKNGVITLRHTTRNLRTALHAEVEGAMAAVNTSGDNESTAQREAAGMVMFDRIRLGEASVYIRLHAAMIMRLITTTNVRELFEDVAPETLRFDVRALMAIRAQFHDTVIAARIMLISENVLFQRGRARDAALVELQRRLGSFLNDTERDLFTGMDGALALVRGTIGGVELHEGEDGRVRQTLQMFVRAVEAGTVTDSVTRLIQSRLSMLMQDMLTTFGGRFPGAGEGTHLVFAQGAVRTHLEGRIMHMVRRLSRIIAVNREVHTEIYNRIIRSIIQRAEDAANNDNNAGETPRIVLLMRSLSNGEHDDEYDRMMSERRDED